MHLMPTAGCQISILIFKKKLWRGASIKSHKKYIKYGKVLAHFWLFQISKLIFSNPAVGVK
jgi:hypothetical protein